MNDTDFSQELIFEILMQSRAAIRSWNRFSKTLKELFEPEPENSDPDSNNRTPREDYPKEQIEVLFESLQSFLYAAAIVSSILFPSDQVPEKYRALNEVAKANAEVVRAELNVTDGSPLRRESRELRNELTHVERSILQHMQVIPKGSYAPFGVGESAAGWLHSRPVFRRIRVHGSTVGLYVGKVSVHSVRPLVDELERLTYAASGLVGLQGNKEGWRLIWLKRTPSKRPRLAKVIRRLRLRGRTD